MSGSAAHDEVAPTAPLLHLQLLGGFAASRQGGPQPPERWTRPSARTLVKLLAVAPDHQLHREQVIDACWPDADAQGGLGSLRVALHAARRALEPELASRAASAYLLSDGALLRLDPETVRVDLDAAERLAAVALEGRDPGRLAEALGAWAGELLPEDRYAAWLQPRRDRVVDLVRRLRVARAEALLGLGDLEGAATVARALLAEAPTDEQAHRLVIEALLAQGLRREAVRQFHRCRDVLDAELGLRPDPETVLLYRRALDTGGPTTVVAGGRVAPPPVLALDTGPLRGRDRELADLERWTGASVHLLAGESGLGKTRLVTESARRAHDRGEIVLWGSGHDAEGRTPYGAFVEALDGWLVGRPSAERARLGIEYPELAALLPSLGRAGADPERSPEQERERLFGATVALLRDLADVAPVLLVLDDLHAADTGSWQLLGHLARMVVGEGLRVRMVVVHRGGDLADAAASVLATLQRTGLCREVPLGRLDREHCVELAADAMGVSVQAVPERIWSLSLGNPLFALEVAHDGGEDETPRGVRQLVEARLAGLPPATRAIVDVVAVAGGHAGLPDLVDVAAEAVHPRPSPAEVTEGVEQAVAALLLDERDVMVDGRSVPGLTFRHPLLRLTCYDSLSAARRRLLHTAYAEAVLRTRPDAVDTLAAHLGRADDPRATLYLRAAAQRAAAMYANDAADQYYAELTVRLDAHAADAAAARIERGTVLRRMGRFGQAAVVLREAVAGLRARGDRDGVVLATARLAEVLAKTDPPHEALAMLDAEAPDAETSPGAATAHFVSRSLVSGVAGRYADAVTAARRARSYAERMTGAERRGLLARALSLMATSLALDGRFAEAGPIADEALPHAEAYGDPQVLGTVLSVLREQARRSGRLDDAVVIGRRALALDERAGNDVSAAFELANLAELLLLLGDLVQARDAADRAVGTPETAQTWATPYALVARARVAMEAGDDDVLPWLDRAAVLVGTLGDHQAGHEVALARVEWALRGGRQDEAGAVLATLDGPGVAILRAWAALASGDADRAARIATAELDRARDAGERLAEVDAGLAAAAALTAAGDVDRARSATDDAAALATRLGYTPSFSRALALR